MVSALVSSILTAAGNLTAALSQSDTNGASVLGTDSAPTLPQFLTNNPLPNGFPWSTKTVYNTNPYLDPPNTGVIRTYDFTLKREQKAPDGYLRDVIVINGQFPGPTIEANWGDTIQVTVHNQITGPDEGTSIHWHGLLQKETPYYDGVPAVQQCPIAPGKSFTYSFQADLYGTTWYHSHYSAQYAAGALGPLIIYGPTNAPYDIDVGPIFINDWYHRDYFSILEDVMGTDLTKIAPLSDNNLINGKMDFNCSLVTNGNKCTNNAGLANFRFSPGKVHRLRLINAGAEGIQKFSIDGHTLTVIANDFVPIKPYNTTIVTLGIGQRTDVLVTGVGNATSAFWMRSSITSCSLASQPNALAVVYYKHGDLQTKPNTTAWPDTTDPCANDDLSLTEPSFPIAPSTPTTTQDIDINFLINSTGHFLWTMNGESFRGDYNSPVLLLASMGNTSYPDSPEWNVYNFGSNSSIRVVVNNQTPLTHPMHLHGHNMQVLSVGPGTWDGTITRPANPQRRDVQLLPASSHLVWQIDADNPGVWPFHCHIAWHVSGGLYVNIMERPADITEKQIPSVLAQTCRDWATFTGVEVVDQIDSGL
jgi:FtsP/CotA-like multicopper oxidase with cupredoxin domain